MDEKRCREKGCPYPPVNEWCQQHLRMFTLPVIGKVPTLASREDREQSRLSCSEMREIRTAYMHGEATLAELSQRFGLSLSTLNRIVASGKAKIEEPTPSSDAAPGMDPSSSAGPQP